MPVVQGNHQGRDPHLQSLDGQSNKDYTHEDSYSLSRYSLYIQNS